MRLNGLKPSPNQLVFIGLGANLGNPVSTIQGAMDRLETLSAQPLLRSSLWKTSPVECPPNSPYFINAAVGLTPEASETPESLLGKLQAMEGESGRVPKKVINEPRILDLDLISFQTETRTTPSLTLPHRRAHQRKFVLAPLNEIAPTLVLPNQSFTVTELLSHCQSREQIQRLESLR